MPLGADCRQEVINADGETPQEAKEKVIAMWRMLPPDEELELEKESGNA